MSQTFVGNLIPESHEKYLIESDIPRVVREALLLLVVTLAMNLSVKFDEVR